MNKNILWNGIAGIVNALEAVVVLAVVSRINSLTEAGILTIAFSLANLLMTIGKYGVRDYQIAKNKIVKFSDFLRSRYITCLSMITVLFLYLTVRFISGDYSMRKASVILLVCFWYFIEAFEDVFAGQLQILDKLHIGSKIFIIRWSLTILCFVFVDIFSKNILISAFLALIAGLMAEIFSLIYLRRFIDFKSFNFSKSGTTLVLKECFPLFLASFLYFFFNNSVKYVIDFKLSDEIQAVFGYISMPVFGISLLNNIIYQPYLMKYVEEWGQSNRRPFWKRILRQYLIVFIIAVLAMAACITLGIPFLSLLYHIDLSDYITHLIILMIGSVFLAIGAFTGTILTIMDVRIGILIGYIITTVFAYASGIFLVYKHGVLGAVFSYFISMAVYAFSLIIIMIIHRNDICTFNNTNPS